MLFDNVTFKKGMDFAAQLYAVHRQLSPIDLRDILLGCFSGLPIAGKNQCDHIRKNIVSPSLDGASPVLMLIAALCSGPLARNLFEKLRNAGTAGKVAWALGVAGLFIITLSFLVNSSYSPFLYAKF